MTNIILCGGSGTRLWPVSREQYPKQFCNLTGKLSMFQETLKRNKELCEKIIVVVNINQYDLAKEQIKEPDIKNIEFILEPLGRNTAPAITIACFALNENDIVLVTPSDQLIKDNKRYNAAIKKAEKIAKEDHMITFGVKPAYPETGFGYIEAKGEEVISFKEKPDRKTAKKYIEAGNYYWNSGMFVFKVKTYLDEIKRHSNEIYTASQEAFEKREIQGKLIKILESYMRRIPADSIDYAVMEKTEKLKMVTLDTDWSDLGSFEAIYKNSNLDKDGNVSESTNVLFNSKDNLIISKCKPVTLIDVNDLIVVNTGDAVLISKMGSSHKIKELIPKLEEVSPGITKKRINIASISKK
jgi:mannose-1-phosphate guanylyltransferase